MILIMISSQDLNMKHMVEEMTRITPEATMVVEKASGRDSPLSQGAKKSSWILPILQQ
jgi:hypothetical protein